MGVRIIAGTARNLELAAPPGVSVRPTLIRVRKALFDSLGPLTGLHVTDLFAGSGALGLESASRGAASVQLVERAADHWPWLDRNAAAVQRTGAAAIRIVRSDVREVSAWGRQVSDLIFCRSALRRFGRIFHRADGNARIPAGGGRGEDHLGDSGHTGRGRVFSDG